MLKISSGFFEEIKEAQERDKFLQQKLTIGMKGKEPELHKDSSGIIKFRDRICTPIDEDLRKLIMDEAHKSS